MATCVTARKKSSSSSSDDDSNTSCIERLSQAITNLIKDVKQSVLFIKFLITIKLRCKKLYHDGEKKVILENLLS
jgi:uncharacterized Fe-S center protein